MTTEILCAWCLREAGKPMGNGSHGICKKHADEIMAQSKERKKKKQQATK